MKGILAMKLLISLIVAVIILVITNYIIKKYQYQQQMVVSSILLNHTIEVSRQITQALKESEKAGIKDCSPKNLDVLREIRSRNKYVDDIGLIKDQQIICTTVWGLLNPPQPLKTNIYKTTNGFLLYLPESDNFYSRNNQSMTSLNNVITYNSALSYTDFLKIYPQYNIRIVSSNEYYIFFSSEDKNTNTRHLWEGMFNVRTEICSKTKDLCIQTDDKKGGLRVLSIFIVALIAIPSLILGYVITSLLERWLKERKSLETRFIRALRKGRLYMVFQPVVLAKDGKMVSLEALVRWNDSIFGQVSPEFFVGLAEKLGLYRSLSDLVVRLSLIDFHEILKINHTLMLSLNIGDDDIKNELYLNRLSSLCSIYGVPVKQIKLEITERCLSSYEDISVFCLSAKNIGFTISIDDFGTGAANIAWLTELDFDEIKIDKFLLKNIDNPDKGKMLLMIVEGLRKTNKRLVFEGIETQQQMDFIRSMDPEFLIQGWLTGRPVTISEIIECIKA